MIPLGRMLESVERGRIVSTLKMPLPQRRGAERRVTTGEPPSLRRRSAPERSQKPMLLPGTGGNASDDGLLHKRCGRKLRRVVRYDRRWRGRCPKEGGGSQRGQSFPSRRHPRIGINCIVVGLANPNCHPIITKNQRALRIAADSGCKWRIVCISPPRIGPPLTFAKKVQDAIEIGTIWRHATGG